MGHLVFCFDQHGDHDPHYHLDASGGQKRFFVRLKRQLPSFLPAGFGVRTYSESDLGVIDKGGRQHMHIRYVQRRFPHSLHLDFLHPEFRPVFEEILRKVFPQTEIEWDDSGCPESRDSR